MVLTYLCVDVINCNIFTICGEKNNMLYIYEDKDSGAITMIKTIQYCV